MLQGDEQTVDIGTNFNDGGTATDVNEVTLGGNDYVVNMETPAVTSRSCPSNRSMSLASPRCT